ncbi:hypothetical protein ACFYW8_43115 [Streptomyces sp. NPDC002742]|jgi:vacuolar-type H+-ATPase subunit D/Vma8|uniref:hypothetical protein n=1 Tax=unclassified Streptomyces TaxID=2593676 RepID=UPI003424CBA1
MINAPIPSISADAVNKLLEQAKSTAVEAAKTVFKDFQLHKAGGIQATTSSGQAFKFDPSLIKYDEKGLTIAGVAIPHVPSLNSLVGPYVERAVKRFKPPKIEEPKATKQDLQALSTKVSTVSRKTYDTGQSVQRLHRTMTQKLDGIQVRMVRQADQVKSTQREVDSLRTGARHTITEMDALLELMTDLEQHIGR